MYECGEKELIHKKVISTTRGEDVTLFHRDPTTTEVSQYNNEAVRRKGNKVQFRHAGAQLKFGAKILKGIGENDFGINGVPFSSDPNSPNYREDWKAIVVRTAHQAVQALGAAVFGGTEVYDEAEDMPEGDAGGDEGDTPLIEDIAKN